MAVDNNISDSIEKANKLIGDIYSKVQKIVDEKNGIPELKKFLDHDVNNALSVFVIFEEEEEEEGESFFKKKLKNNKKNEIIMYLKMIRKAMRLLTNALGSAKYFFDKRATKAEVKKVSGIKIKQSLLGIMELALDKYFSKNDTGSSFDSRKNILEKIKEIPEKIFCNIHFPIIENLVFNIIGNAKKRGKANQLDLDYKIEKEKDGKGFLVISIRDDGEGIKENISQEDLLGTNRDKANIKNSGLGLGGAIGRMRIFGGKIYFEGRGGLPNKNGSHGAKFILKIPLE